MNLQTSPKDADQIFSAIDWRVQQLRMEEQKDAQASTATSSPTKATSAATVADEVAVAKRTRPFDDEWQTEHASNVSGKKFK